MPPGVGLVSNTQHWAAWWDLQGTQGMCSTQAPTVALQTSRSRQAPPCYVNFTNAKKLVLEIAQTQMTQKPVLRGEVERACVANM